jgi:hypothetical protein
MIDDQTTPFPTALAISFGSLAVHFAIWALLSAIIIYAAFQQMCGRPVNIAEAAARVLPRSLSLIGITFISILGMTIGIVLAIIPVIFSLLGITVLSVAGLVAGLVSLTIPGIFLMVIWYVASAACVVEKRGVLKSLKRSRELTKGYRWRILALMLVIMLASVMTAGLTAAAQAAGAGTWGQIAVEFVWMGLSGGFSAVLIAASYYYLRVVKEGADAGQIAAVFD